MRPRLRAFVARHRDYWTQRGVIPRWQYFGVYIAIIAVVIVGFRLLSSEAAQRRDQNCIFFERQWQTDVDNLARTYEYLDNLSPQQRAEPLNVAILRGLRTQELKVGTPKRRGAPEKPGAEKPPPYCKGDVGLDDSKFEPIPQRPRSLR